MTLVHSLRASAPGFGHAARDYLGELLPFVERVPDRTSVLPLAVLKTIEWAIYRWYHTPIRRFYGVKSNELLYMITRRCTDACAKCGIWKHPEADDEHLPVDRFLDALRRLAANLHQVTITGGEPLLFAEDVLRIAEECRRLEVPLVVVTAGTLLTERFLRSYAALGHAVVISIDTLDRAKWAAFRGRDNHAVVWANLERARRLLPGRLRVQSVLAAETADDVAAVAAWCRAHGLPHSVQPYQDFGGRWHPAAPYVDDGAPCAARKNICVYPNGDVVRCFDHRRIPLAREPLGSLLREDVVTILSRRRSTQVSRLMQACNEPCKQMACNRPPERRAP